MMATKCEPKKKCKRTISNLPKQIFDRLHLIIAFEEDSTQLKMESSIFESYAPRVLSSCSTSCKKPKDPLDIAAFERVTNVPGRTPFYARPNIPQSIPAGSGNRIFVKTRYPSLIPLLMTAKSSGIDTRRYHVVTQRNSLRKMAMNNEDFVINVVRFGSTLFLRCFGRFRTVDKNDVGHRFEYLCTSNSNRNCSYNQLVDGRIGKYKILLMGETDAINKENGESIELKCQKSNASKMDEHDWWLQAYLTGTKTIIHGRRAKGDETVTELKHYKTSSLSNRITKNKMFNRLDSVLNLLFSNVVSGRTYMLRGHIDETTNERRIRLYEVIDDKDKKKLSFITHKLLQTLTVDK